MRLLLDTHVFIWWVGLPEKLSERVTTLLGNRDNELFLSVASVWEMQIKLKSGKLTLDLPLEEMILNQQEENDLNLLNIDVADVWVLDGLPVPHRDPFDRMIIAQSIRAELSLMSVDRLFDSYPIKRLW
ncbi:MAG: type II toxin-antitoxin system VapC family toxin [Sodalinema sp.]|uniref:type II toxin-antitoxin system VapC family toxin n=1 Tax=Sodalinema sp. TaxID=3080550 RepID=UPI00396F3313